MILIGMFDSAFVRRVAISMNLYGMAFEHRNWSVGPDFDRIRQYNPLGRVPTLVLPDGEALIESSAILDYLDERAGPERALLPPSGKDRRTALRLMSIAIGAAEKGVLQIYETVFRPAEKRHQPCGSLQFNARGARRTRAGGREPHRRLAHRQSDDSGGHHRDLHVHLVGRRTGHRPRGILIPQTRGAGRALRGAAGIQLGPGAILFAGSQDISVAVRGGRMSYNSS
jgi:glutathione S-transferase